MVCVVVLLFSAAKVVNLSSRCSLWMKICTILAQKSNRTTFVVRLQILQLFGRRLFLLLNLGGHLCEINVYIETKLLTLIRHKNNLQRVLLRQCGSGFKSKLKVVV